MPTPIQISKEHLLNAVVKMSKGEFDRFLNTARKQRQNGGTEKAVSPAEADLLHRINTIFPADKRKRYDALYAKFKTHDIGPSEHAELAGLIDDFELLNVDRLKLIAKLAKLRNQSMDEVISIFELKIAENA